MPICSSCSGESIKPGCDRCLAVSMEKNGLLVDGKKHCRCYANNHNKEEAEKLPPFSPQEQAKIEELKTIEKHRTFKKRSYIYDYWSDDELLELFNWLIQKLNNRLSLLVPKPLNKEVLTE